MKIIFLLLINLKLILSCDLFQTKRTCECTVVYSLGDDPTRKKLFDLPSYDDCGINLGCELNECGLKCLKSVLKLLGNREDYITEQGRDKVCDLLAKQNEQISSKNGIKIWAAWKYSTCRTGLEPVVQDVCCNRKCDCNIISQDVSSINSIDSVQTKKLADLVDLLPPKKKSYYCSLSEIEECKKECLYASSYFFSNPNIVSLFHVKHNLNIFYEPLASNKVCNLIGMPKYKPGADIFAEVSVGLNISNFYISLGRVCCQNKCNCELVFKDAINGQDARTNHFLSSLELDSQKTIGYECSNEMSDCKLFCRKNGFYVLNNFDSTVNKNETIPETDGFQVQGFASYICNLIKIERPNDNQGFNVYIRYTNGESNLFPNKEDMHIGRICCEFLLGQFVGLNRCDSTIPLP